VNKKPFVVLVIMLASLLAACGAGTASSGVVPTATVAPAPTLAPVPTATSLPIPADLVGTYSKTLAPPDILPIGAGTWVLTLSQDGSYSLTTPDAHIRPLNGMFSLTRVAQIGNEITFFHDQCGGQPTYTWQLTGNQLTINVLFGDSCGARIAILSNKVWIKGPTS
jgi:hypothetical protein